jgi:hypothetical protein
MKKIILLAAIASLGATMPVMAKNHGKGPEVTERDSKGRPTKVKIGDQEYTLCTSDNSDGCINPREAGFKFGNHTAKDWPGRPISRER